MFHRNRSRRSRRSSTKPSNSATSSSTIRSKTSRSWAISKACRLRAILLDNAIKYSPPKSTIELASGIRGRQGYILVQDHGQGINASDVPHIFYRFCHTSRNKEQTNGYGLGLSIAKQIVEAHKGSIEVRTVAGKGSTFSVLFATTSSRKRTPIIVA